VLSQLLSNPFTIISLGWFNGIVYYAHHWSCSRYLDDPQSERHDIRENLGVFISNVLFLSIFRAVSLRKTSMETLAVTLALTENSNVSQTLGVHLRRKRVAAPHRNVLNGGRERVNQSLVAFSRRCMPCYTPIRETGRERGFYLIGRKFPLLGNLLFTQDHLDEAILPHNGIIANPVSYFIKFHKKVIVII